MMTHVDYICSFHSPAAYNTCCHLTLFFAVDLSCEQDVPISVASFITDRFQTILGRPRPQEPHFAHICIWMSESMTYPTPFTPYNFGLNNINVLLKEYDLSIFKFIDGEMVSMWLCSPVIEL